MVIGRVEVLQNFDEKHCKEMVIGWKHTHPNFKSTFVINGKFDTSIEIAQNL